MLKDFLRKIALKLRRKRFSKISGIQNDVTIISNNCTGAVMYHDLGLQFMSPTINIGFGENGDFLIFILNLKKYCTQGTLTLSNIKETRPGFTDKPVGLLSCDGLPTIELHFVHYKDFNEGMNKWFQRIKRINYDKIFVVIEAQTNYEKSMIQKYVNIPYPKIIFTDEQFPYDCCVKMPFYKKYGKGINYPILKLVSLTGRRGYDTYDFVGNIFKRDYNALEADI